MNRRINDRAVELRVETGLLTFRAFLNSIFARSAKGLGECEQARNCVLLDSVMEDPTSRRQLYDVSAAKSLHNFFYRPSGERKSTERGRKIIGSTKRCSRSREL